MSKIPKSLQGILWSRNVKGLDLRDDKNYIIHQILAYGAWNHLKWLFRNYDTKQVREVFLNQPSKDYSERSFNFVQKILLEIPTDKVDKRYYVKTYPRIIG